MKKSIIFILLAVLMFGCAKAKKAKEVLTDIIADNPVAEDVTTGQDANQPENKTSTPEVDPTPEVTDPPASSPDKAAGPVKKLYCTFDPNEENDPDDPPANWGQEYYVEYQDDKVILAKAYSWAIYGKNKKKSAEADYSTYLEEYTKLNKLSGFNGTVVLTVIDADNVKLENTETVNFKEVDFKAYAKATDRSGLMINSDVVKSGLTISKYRKYLEDATGGGCHN